MKCVIKLALRNIKAWLGDLRAASAFLLGIGICIYNISGYMKFSKLLESPVQVFEPYILAGSTATFFLLIFLGVLLLLSNAPFITPLSGYEILRTGHKTWVKAQILYIVLSCMIYSIATLCFTMLFFTLLGTVSFSNNWSDAIVMLAEQQPVFALEFGLSFPYPDFIYSLSPISAVCMTFFFNSLYIVFISLIMFYINIISTRNWGWVVASFLHIWGYIVYANVGITIPLEYSLLCRALPAYHFLKLLDMSPITTVALFAVAIIFLVSRCIRSAVKMEI